MQAEGVVFLNYKTLYFELIEAVGGSRHAEKLDKAFGPFPADLPQFGGPVSGPVPAHL